MCPHKEWFSDYEDVPDENVFMDNNISCPVKGKGTVKLRLSSGKRFV